MTPRFETVSEMIAERGRLAWQVVTNYGQRSVLETTLGRYMALIGPRLRVRGFATQQTEAATGVAVPLSGAYFGRLALFVPASPFQRLDNGAAASLSPNGTTSALS
jgi:hypothetical protein